MIIRPMTALDYDRVMTLWSSSDGVGISPDDSREYITKYLERNPRTSFVAVESGKVIGAIMAGHDGYRGFIHHTGVSEEHRGKGVGSALVSAALEAIKAEGITKTVLVVFKSNDRGNEFWKKQGFEVRDDLFYRDMRF